MRKQDKELSFEEALHKLETIVDELERNTDGIESALEKYEEGIKLYKYCYKKLNDIQGRIEILLKDGLGDVERKDFEIDEHN